MPECPFTVLVFRAVLQCFRQLVAGLSSFGYIPFYRLTAELTRFTSCKLRSLSLSLKISGCTDRCLSDFLVCVLMEGRHSLHPHEATSNSAKQTHVNTWSIKTASLTCLHGCQLSSKPAQPWPELWEFRDSILLRSSWLGGLRFWVSCTSGQSFTASIWLGRGMNRRIDILYVPKLP